MFYSPVHVETCTINKISQDSASAQLKYPFFRDMARRYWVIYFRRFVNQNLLSKRPKPNSQRCGAISHNNVYFTYETDMLSDSCRCSRNAVYCIQIFYQKFGTDRLNLVKRHQIKLCENLFSDSQGVIGRQTWQIPLAKFCLFYL